VSSFFGGGGESDPVAGAALTTHTAATTSVHGISNTAVLATATTLTTNGMGIVVHGATAATTRPSTFAFYVWVGSVEPTNAINSDLWVNTA